MEGEDYCPNLTGWGGGKEDYCPNLTGCGGKKITVPI